jgi:flavin-dependent dehydrogenase
VARADLAIAGAGPVGLAVAIQARLRGLSAVVLEPRRPPLDKACGEGLMPIGVEELRAMGVRLPALQAAPFAGIRFVDGEARAEGRFAPGRGLGVRRTALSQALLERARELGAELRFGVAVAGFRAEAPGRVRVRLGGPAGWDALEAGLLVGADGLHSAVRRLAGLEARGRRIARHGMRRHFRVASEPAFVEVHWARGAEAYLTPIAPREIGLALLWSGAPARYDALLERFPSLERRLAGAAPTSRVLGASRFEQRLHRRTAPGVALVGDAAGYLDPLTGEGITLGLRCARALVDAVARGAPLADYERAYARLSRTYYRMTALLLLAARRPGLRRRLVRALARDPALFDRLLAIQAGAAPMVLLGAGGVLRLAAALARQGEPMRPAEATRTSTKRSTRRMNVL